MCSPSWQYYIQTLAADFESEARRTKAGQKLAVPRTKASLFLHFPRDATFDDLPADNTWEEDEWAMQRTFLRLCCRYRLRFITQRVGNGEKESWFNRRFTVALRQYNRATGQSLVKKDITAASFSWTRYQAEHFQAHGVLDIVEPGPEARHPSPPIPQPTGVQQYCDQAETESDSLLLSP